MHVSDVCNFMVVFLVEFSMQILYTLDVANCLWDQPFYSKFVIQDIEHH